jgi:hypothetical protein
MRGVFVLSFSTLRLFSAPAAAVAGECLLYNDSVVVSPGCDVRGILNGVTTSLLLVVCGVGNGECRGQLIQERKPRPMLAVCQLTDVRGACEAGRGSGWRALCWKCEDKRGDGSGRRRSGC